MASDFTVNAEPVHFKEAIDFFRSKLRLGTRAWTDIWQDQHARTFVVAGAMKDDLVKDFQEAVGEAIAEGKTLDQFRKEFDDIVARHGWSYNGGRGWRSRVIFQTNMRGVYASGRWQQVERQKSRRPFARYVAVRDDNTRPEHQAWHNTILPVDDPFWTTHGPPNGWGCRCRVQSLSARDVKRLGLKVSEKAPEIRMRDAEVNTPEGRVRITVPEGIDPGFAWNPGQPANEPARLGG
ncbi:phage minor head protein [Parvibaculaceae bacterium PLY_AMNH_Bact1]|nr:phage minor head protein [Parvibaculaceae bacterium PLY_AMNH_Bact1]